jgi:WD40 repeat protein
MDHPNIARVFDAGATDSGRPFFVMQWVNGLRLTDHCNKHTLSLPERLRLFLLVCQAIEHAHQKGVIHRDIKPSNILVTVHDSIAVPKVIDFGIAKAIQAPTTEETLFTQAHELIGTPAYMSPEQAELSGLDLDTRTDIYSLGVLLYELLTGETPFDARALLQSGLDELRRTIRETEPDRPSTRLKRQKATNGPAKSQIANHKSQINPDLDWIVMKCLEKDRRRRYDTASGLAQDILNYLNDKPIAARPPSPPYVLGKMVSRNRGSFAALAAILFLLIAGAAVSSIQAVRAGRAERAERQLRQEAQLSERRARKASEQARLQAYTSDMKSAASALQINNLGQARDLLSRYFPKPGQADLRGIEWRYLWQASHGDQLQTIPLDHFVSCVCVSPNAQLLATHTFSGSTRVIQISSGRTLAAFAGAREKDSLDNLAFSIDGKLLAEGTTNNVLIRDTSTWQVQNELRDSCEALSFSADGGTLAVLNDSGVHLYATDDWHKRETLPSLGAGPGRLAFLGRSGELAVLRRTSPNVELWELSSRSKFAVLQGIGFVIALAASPDGRWLATGSSEGELRVWEVSTRSSIAQIKAHPRWLHSLAFSPDGQLLASGGGDQLIRLWNTSDLGQSYLKESVTLKGHRNEVWSLAFSADGTRLASGGKDSLAMIWNANPQPDKSACFLTIHGGMAIGFMADPQQFLVLAGNLNELQIWNVPNNRLLGKVQVQPHGVLLYNPPTAYFGTTNGTIESWLLPEGRCANRIQVSEGPINALAVSADQRFVFGWDKVHEQAALWRLKTGARVRDFCDFATNEAPASWSKAQRVAFSPNNRWLAYASSNYTVKVWDLQLDKEASTLAGHTWHVECLRFSPDTSCLATGSWDASVRLWDPSTGVEKFPALKGHLSGIADLSFSADGRTLAVRSSDDLLHFWSTINGAEMLVIPNVTAWFLNMISQDGNALAWEVAPDSNRFRVQYLPALAEIDARESE